MNKRPIIFVIVLTLALFLLNQYFGSQESERRATYVQENRKKETEELQKTVTDEQLKRTAPIASLPIIKLYEDKDCQNLATLAVAQGSQFLTVAWDSSLPKTLYTHETTQNCMPAVLRIAPEKKGDVVLYSTESNAQLMTAMPDEGNLDVQIITFSEINKEAKATLGLVQEGRFIGPVQPLAAKGIVLYNNSPIGYLPWGTYDPANYQFSPLASLPYFSGIASVKIPPSETVDIHDQEEFYVLENPYLQLVFSNVGGSLSEINLPLRSDSNQASVVLPTDLDRRMAHDYGLNDYFPLFPYHTAEAGTTLQNGKLGGYYPLIRRPILSSGNHVTSPVAPRYYALNIVDEDPETAKTLYTVKRFQKNLIEFQGSQKGRTITKTFTLPKDPDLSPYAFELNVTIDGSAERTFLTSGVPEVELVSNNFTPSLKYRVIKQNKGVVDTLSLPKDTYASSTIYPDWVSNSNGFFGIILDPTTKEAPGLTARLVPGNALPSRLTMIDSAHQLYPAEKYPGYELLLPFEPKKKNANFLVYAGPYEKNIFEKVDAAFYSESQGKSPDFEAAQSVQGWFSFISEPFAKFLFFLLKFFHFATHSWGLSIILLTVALRIMLYPLNAWSIRSTLKMQEIAPHVQALQARYKKEPKRAQMEIMHLYREKGVNPLSGCFPLLIQLPFLIGMFDLLKSTFALRGARFIPGWIDDLAAPDVLFSWNYPIFFFGNQFHLLPIILGVVMYIQQRFSASATMNANQPMTDQQRQQKFMGNIMVVVFSVMFYNFPSGLNIYWLSSMLLGILQQWWMTKKTKKTVVEVLK